MAIVDWPCHFNLLSILISILVVWFGVTRVHDRILLNKADSLDQQALLRVYGALMWSLGKVIRTPEVLSVHSLVQPNALTVK
jgi:hypothetical protein